MSMTGKCKCTFPSIIIEDNIPLKSEFPKCGYAKLLLSRNRNKNAKYCNKNAKLLHKQGFPDGSVVKNPPAKQETQIRYLGWEDPLEMGVATQSSILAWRIPWIEAPGRGARGRKQSDTNEAHAHSANLKNEDASGISADLLISQRTA